MSMSKSRNEKKPPVQAAPILVTNDIIPGKFNENQWNLMIEQENTQGFISDIVDNIVDYTIKIIYDKYIESQLKPYSVDATKKLLLQIIETRFLAHDKGEQFPENDLTWQEDEEPVPCVTDSWSQGSVPVQQCPTRPLTARSNMYKSDTNLDNIAEQSESDTQLIHSKEGSEIMIIEHDQVEQEETNEIVTEENISAEPNVTLSTEIVPSPPTTPKSNKGQPLSSSNSRRRTGTKSQDKKKRQARTTSPQLQSWENNTPVVNTGGTHDHSTSFSVLPKVQSGRPPAEAEVTYDEHGNIIGMLRLSVDKLPTHRVRTKFNIGDSNDLLSPSTSKSSSRKMTSKESVLNQLRDTQGSSIIKKRQENLKSSLEMKRGESKRELPPPLADSVNISAGVIIREGQVVRKGPELYLGHSSPHDSKRKQDILSLQPVGSLTTKQTISVSDVIGKTSPVIRQMRITEPIPPIATYHRS